METRMEQELQMKRPTLLAILSIVMFAVGTWVEFKA